MDTRIKSRKVAADAKNGAAVRKTQNTEVQRQRERRVLGFKRAGKKIGGSRSECRKSNNQHRRASHRIIVYYNRFIERRRSLCHDRDRREQKRSEQNRTPSRVKHRDIARHRNCPREIQEPETEWEWQISSPSLARLLAASHARREKSQKPHTTF